MSIPIPSSPTRILAPQSGNVAPPESIKKATSEPQATQVLSTKERLSQQRENLATQIASVPAGSAQSEGLKKEWHQVNARLIRYENLDKIYPYISKSQCLQTSREGQVFRITDDNQTDFIVKRAFKSSQFNELRAMMHLENLDVPHRIPLILSAEDDESYYMLIPFYKNGDMIDYIENSGKALSLAQVQKLGIELLTYLAALEEAGVTHLDIKPENIYFDESGHLRVGDPANLRSRKNYSELGPHLVIGSPAYYPPEQILGSDKTCSSDVWSAGVTLFNLFTFSTLFGIDENIYLENGRLNFKQVQIDLLYQIVPIIGAKNATELCMSVSEEKIGIEGLDDPTEEPQPALGFLLREDGTVIDTAVSPEVKIVYVPIDEQLKNAARKEHEIAPDDPALADFIDLIRKMISWPADRPTAKELLQHRFFAREEVQAVAS